MSTLKAYHHYQLRDAVKKTSMHIENIIPVADREVSEVMFNEYEDLTPGNGALATMVKFDCMEG